MNKNNNLEEKGIIFDIKRSSFEDGPGIRTTVFLKGCNLACKWCHNPEGVSKAKHLMFENKICIFCRECERVCEYDVHKFTEEHILNREKCTFCGKCIEVCPSKAVQICGEEITTSQLMKVIERDKIFYDNSGGGLTISGGEPFTQNNFLTSLLKAAKQKKINTLIETNGNWSLEKVKDILPLIDWFYFDMKLMDSQKHKEFTGGSNKNIIKNLKWLTENISKKQTIVISLPLIGNVNDTDENIDSLLKLLKSLKNIKKILINPYNNYYKSKLNKLGKKEFVKFKTPTKKRISKIKNKFKKEGFEVL